jgi:hypothetical protein
MLDPDPYQMYTDPKHWFPHHFDPELAYQNDADPDPRNTASRLDGLKLVRTVVKASLVRMYTVGAE